MGKAAADGVREKEKSDVEVMSRPASTALAELSPLSPGEPLAFYDVPDADLHAVQIMEKRAWLLHDQTFRQWHDTLTDPSTKHLSIVFLKEMAGLQEAHKKARREREEWELRERMTFKQSEIQEFVKKVIAPLGELLDNIDTELPSVANPDDQPFARQAIARWKREKLQPSIMALFSELEELQAA
jgi:hypothetical protein